MKPSGESTRRVVPARAGAADGVEGDAGDHHPGVLGVGVDGDPLAGARFAPGLQPGRVERAFEEAAAVQGEADRARAVIARGFEGAMAAAPDVGGGRDRVGGGDRVLDRRRRRGRGARLAFVDQPGGFAGVERRRDLAGRRRRRLRRRSGWRSRRGCCSALLPGFPALPSLRAVRPGRTSVRRSGPRLGAGGGDFALVRGDGSRALSILARLSVSLATAAVTSSRSVLTRSTTESS